MKILVFGARGWIGSQMTPLLAAAGFEVVEASARADDEVAVAALLDAERPDRVLSVIGRTRGGDVGTIDFLEDEAKCHDKLVLNLRDNLYGPLTLALACRARGVHFSYLGTGCIFSYAKEGQGEAEAFDEASDPNFFGSAYSVVKGYTDRLMRQVARDGVLQVRIRMPLTADRSPYNFITKITSYERICSVENSMTVLPTLLPVFVDLIRRAHRGTVNLTNPGTISHDRILEHYRRIVDGRFAWRNFTEAEQNEILRSRRSNNRLCTDELTRLYPDVPGIEEAVVACLRTLAATAP